MIKYGLKIWSNNSERFDEIVECYKRNEFDFIEIYSNSEVPHDYNFLYKIKQVPVFGVHIGHLDKARFHNFFLADEQKKAWQMTVDLADFFEAPRIIVHPATEHTEKTFWENLKKLNDGRIIIESMPVVSPIDIGLRKFGASIEDLIKIHKKKDICLDIIKYIKACAYYKIDYKEYIQKALEKLEPVYFHISGGNYDSPVDQHDNIWKGNCDWKWIKETLENYSKVKDIYLVFETPKVEENLDNEIKNMEYFKNS